MSLTEMERKVFSYIAEMKTTDDIAQELFISSRTVETHRHNICSKLNIHGANALLNLSIIISPFCRLFFYAGKTFVA